MTKREFEKIADFFAERESQIEEMDVTLAEKIAARLSHRRTVMDFSNMLAAQYPRFNKAKFEMWSLPIYTKLLKAGVVARINHNPIYCDACKQEISDPQRELVVTDDYHQEHKVCPQ